MSVSSVKARARRALRFWSSPILVMALAACSNVEPSTDPAQPVAVQAIYVLDVSPSGESSSRVVSLRSSDLSVISEWPSGYSPTFSVSEDGSWLVIASQDPDGSDWLEIVDTTEGKSVHRVPIEGRALWIGPPLGNPRMAIVGTSVAIYSYDVVAPDHADYSVTVYDLDDPARPPASVALGGCGISAWLLPTGSDSLAVVCPDSDEVVALTFDGSEVQVRGRVTLPRDKVGADTPDGLSQVVGAEIMADAKTVVAVTGLGTGLIIDLADLEVVSERRWIENGAYVALGSVSLAPDGDHLLLGTGVLGRFLRATAHRLVSVDTSAWETQNEASVDPFVALEALPGGSVLTLGEDRWAGIVTLEGTVITSARAITHPSLAQVVVR